MTIKKRLFLSNILMIIIPAVVGITVAIVTAAACKDIIYRQVVAELEEKNSRIYMAENFISQYNSYDNLTEKILIYFLCLVIFLLVAGAIFATNRFLTMFVFKKIEKPIDILVKGVNQIRDGNIDYKIEYSENDEFLPVCQDFNEMAYRLKESVENTQKNEQNRKELIAGISHDIRTPLTSIKAYIEGLLDGVASTPEMQQKYMETIRQKANDIDSMVDKLFLFSKLDLGEYPFYPEGIDIENEIEKIIEENEYSKNGMNVILESIPEKIIVYADPVQFRNSIINILENSIKYKDEDTVTVNIKCLNFGELVKIIIEDNGPGADDDALDKLFDVFYRNDPSRNNPSKGSGLGLAITAKILERFGGSIRAENVNPKGLRIIITLPKKENKTNAGENSDN